MQYAQTHCYVKSWHTIFWSDFGYFQQKIQYISNYRGDLKVIQIQWPKNLFGAWRLNGTIQVPTIKSEFKSINAQLSKYMCRADISQAAMAKGSGRLTRNLKNLSEAFLNAPLTSVCRINFLHTRFLSGETELQERTQLIQIVQI